VKQYSDAVVSEGAEAASAGLDHLDLRVEPFGHGIGDAMRDVVEQPDLMLLEHGGHLRDRVQLTSLGLPQPAPEECASRGLRREQPEVLEGFPHAPRLGDLQIPFPQFFEALLFFGFPVVRILQEEIFSSGQPILRRLGEWACLEKMDTNSGGFAVV
jgi:hypothetical protein